MVARSSFVAALLCGALLVAGCGGGGGGGAAQQDLFFNALSVPGQVGGNGIPFSSTSGGQAVTIDGSGFQTGVSVEFGGVVAPQVTVQSGSRIVATAPAHVTEIVDVTLRLDGQSAELLAAFEYIRPPTVFSILAVTGPTTGEPRATIEGGDTVEITGADFRTGAVVFVNGQDVIESFQGPNSMRFIAPPNGVEESHDVTVINPEQLSSTLPSGLAYTQEFSLASEADALTLPQATHLVRRMGLGATPAETAAAVAAGLNATILQLMNYTNDDAVEQEALTLFTTPPPVGSLSNSTLQRWWVHILRNNPNAFQERFAFFLHDHFATSGRDMSADSRWTLYNQVNLFRRFSMATSQALDNGESGLDYSWRAILVEICKDRAMLDWLDGRLSTASRPNENFSRELWELFMLGEGAGYTQQDIVEAAKAFTGFFWYRPTSPGLLDYSYRPGRHNGGPKTIFGKTGNWGYDDIAPFWHADGVQGTPDPNRATDPDDTDGGIVELTLTERPTYASEFICRKIAAHFLYENPHDDVVAELAADLVASDWNLRPVLIKIFSSRAMFSARAIKGNVKSPVDYVLGLLRTTDRDLHTNINTNARRIISRLEAIGQVPLAPPDVNGWPEGTAWMGSQAMLERINFVNQVIRDLDNFTNDVEPLLPPAGQRDAASMVSHFAQMLDVELSSEAQTRFVSYVDDMRDGGNNPIAYDPTSTTHLTTKTRGLIYMLAQYHNAHQR